ncbi:MAG: 6-phosphogluconolactonase [Candidatus Binatia bacterium]|nr:MAG: 6-phosphogluconolactonase [Candidatus Binatia bacterium]
MSGGKQKARRRGVVEWHARHGDSGLAILPDREALARAAAARFVSAARRAIGARGRFAVALSGGSTPRRLYDILATRRYAARVDWARVHVFWGDERCVPPDHPASNYGAARRALLDHVPVPEANVHRIRGEDDPARAAVDYEGELRAFFRTPGGPPRCAAGSRFDLVLLGMGADGHTASLFPGSPSLEERERWAVAVWGAGMWRVTLTLPVINAAAEIVVLVAGREKAAVLQKALRGARGADELPVQRIDPPSGRLWWLADASAASGSAPSGGRESVAQ